LLKSDDFVCNNDVSQVIERLLKDVPLNHLLVFCVDWRRLPFTPRTNCE